MLGGGCLYLYIKNDKPSRYLPYILSLLVLIDLWGVDKRYLNKSHFIKAHAVQQLYSPSVSDRMIMQDKDPSYRVLSLQDPFNNSGPSYFHKSIGGYSAAKLRRYQDLIEIKLAPEIELLQRQLAKAASVEEAKAAFKTVPILNMLNMRYLIIDPNQAPLKNPYAYGNAWFVSSVKVVDNADEEMVALQTNDPHEVALVDKRFETLVSSKKWTLDSTATVKLVSYKPDRLEYKYTSSQPGMMLFSEVYYPHGWKAMIDGQPAEHFRANWILRGMEVPAGEHTISFYFHPDVYMTGRWIGTICSGLLVLGLLLVIFYYGKKMAKSKENIG